MKKRYRMWLALLCGISILTTTHISQAVNYDQKIKEAEQEQKSYEKKADELQKEMEEIEASKEDTLAYIEKLDKKTSELEEELENLEAQIGTAQTAYDKVQEELAAAEAEEKKQYDAMKKRIKYMYENGNQEYLEILFGATSIQDLLNRSEYVEKISDYDKNIFEEYRKIKSEVEEKEQESQTRLQELQDLESETEEEKTVERIQGEAERVGERDGCLHKAGT
jgi:peptidoglycan hydrolase CwlO-like protein